MRRRAAGWSSHWAIASSRSNYNAVLYRDGKGVLPAQLEGPIGNARDPAHGGYTFDASDLSHPIVAPFRGNPGAGLDRAVTLEYIQAKIAAGSPARVALQVQLRRSGDHRAIDRTRPERAADDVGRRLVEHVARPSDVPAD